jgi:hypothetical protein
MLNRVWGQGFFFCWLSKVWPSAELRKGYNLKECKEKKSLQSSWYARLACGFWGWYARAWMCWCLAMQKNCTWTTVEGWSDQYEKGMGSEYTPSSTLREKRSDHTANDLHPLNVRAPHSFPDQFDAEKIREIFIRIAVVWNVGNIQNQFPQNSRKPSKLFSGVKSFVWVLAGSPAKTKLGPTFACVNLDEWDHFKNTFPMQGY